MQCAYDVALVGSKQTFVMSVPEVAAVGDGNLFIGAPWAVSVLL